MPDRLTSRAALAVLLLLLTIAGIGVAGPAISTRTAALPVVIGTGFAMEAVLGVLLFALRWPASRTAAARRTATASQAAAASQGPAARLRMILTGVIVIGLIAIPAGMLLAAITRLRPLRRLEKRRAVHTGRPPRLRLGHRAHATGTVFPVQYVLIGLLVVAIVVAAILIWRRRRAWARDRIDVPPEDEADTPAELARAVDSGRVALREVDDARAAIIACYVAMEESLAEAGAARAAAETPDELLGRAGAAGLVDAAPAGRLTALFYEARFSTHPMARARRHDAERALAKLASSLTPPEKAATAAETEQR
jgi:Domain of unknown function (DUF4129)